ncbi:MAG: hypothetical protein NTX25_23630, partial [Proteobacteria bacterium]|nr:hypothetical protein [Pseudomonadota bacterium]
LLAFSTFMFFGLAALKRYIEVSRLDPKQDAPGRGYRAEDKNLLGVLGAGSSLLSCLVLALYFNSSSVLKIYSNSAILWLVLPLQLYWISRIWILAGRGKIDDDPVLYTLKSKTSYALGVIAVFILWYAH